LHVGFRTCSSYSKDRYILKILKHILNGFSGRLFTIFRTKRGLTYRSSAKNTYHEHSGYFNFHIETDPEKLMVDGKDIGIIPILIELIKDLVKNGVTAKEVEVAKGNFKGNMLIDLQSIDTLAEYNGISTILKDNEVSFNKVYDSYIKSITPLQINKIINKYFTHNNLVVGIVYDHEIEKKKIELMFNTQI
jgi:predicted Zn-dependent peptidase